MTQLALLTLAAIAGWILWRTFGQAVVTRRPPASPAAKRRATPLELDPETGVYRPVDRKEP